MVKTTNNRISYHYHTRMLTEEEKQWYLNNHWSISRFCIGDTRVSVIGNPDQDWHD